MPTTTISPLSVIKSSGNVIYSRIDDEFLAFDAQRGECFSLNETAMQVWQLLSAPTTVDNICRRLSSEYAVEPDTCEQDVIELLASLLDAKLIEVCVAD